jgi:outer membrane lipoprotein-sorting protein
MRPTLVPVLVLSAAALGSPEAGWAQTLDQVVARYLAARGGIEKIRAVTTLRLSGRMTLPGVEVPLVLELKRPNRMRTEFTVNGHTGVRAYDGQDAWTILPVPGLDEPQSLSPDEAKEARDQADVDLSPLVDSQAKGFSLELLGREAGIGQESLRLRVRAADGQERTMSLDAKSYLVTRIEEMRKLEGKDQEFETLVGDYRSVSGLLYPFTIEVAPRKGEGGRQKFTFDKIEVNVPLDDSRFTRPAPPR